MGRLKGGKNKTILKGRVITSSLSTDERLRLLANAIIDQILEDKKNGYLRFNKVTAPGYGKGS